MAPVVSQIYLNGDASSSEHATYINSSTAYLHWDAADNYQMASVLARNDGDYDHDATQTTSGTSAEGVLPITLQTVGSVYYCTIYANFYDAAGNSKTEQVSITWDATAPANTDLQIYDNTTSYCTSPAANVWLRLYASDNSGTVSTASLYETGGTVSERAYTSDSIEWNFVDRTEGLHRINATYADLAGNVSAVVYDDIFLDYTAPQLSQAVSSSTHGTEGTWYNVSVAHVAFSFIDADHLNQTSSLYVSGLSQIHWWIVAPDGSTTCDTTVTSLTSPYGAQSVDATSSLSTGTWIFKAQAQDNAGNLSAVASFTVKVDVTAPTLLTISADSITSGQWTAINIPNVTWTDSDEGSGASDYIEVKLDHIDSYDFDRDGGYTEVDTAGSYTVTNAITDGSWYLHLRMSDTVYATDGSLSRHWSNTETLYLRIDTTPPTINGVSDTEVNFATSTNSTLAFTVSDDNTITSLVVLIYDDSNALVKSLYSSTGTNGTYALSWDGKDTTGNEVTTGNYIYLIEATDDSGRVTSASCTVDISISTVFMPTVNASYDMYANSSQIVLAYQDFTSGTMYAQTGSDGYMSSWARYSLTSMSSNGSAITYSVIAGSNAYHRVYTYKNEVVYRYSLDQGSHWSAEIVLTCDTTQVATFDTPLICYFNSHYYVAALKGHDGQRDLVLIRLPVAMITAHSAYESSDSYFINHGVKATYAHEHHGWYYYADGFFGSSHHWDEKNYDDSTFIKIESSIDLDYSSASIGGTTHSLEHNELVYGTSQPNPGYWSDDTYWNANKRSSCQYLVRGTNETYLKVDEDGSYDFYLMFDDNIESFTIAGLSYSHDGVIGTPTYVGTAVLSKGFNSLYLRWYQGGPTGAYVHLYWKKPGDDDYSIIPNSSLYTDYGPTNDSTMTVTSISDSLIALSVTANTPDLVSPIGGDSVNTGKVPLVWRIANDMDPDARQKLEIFDNTLGAISLGNPDYAVDLGVLSTDGAGTSTANRYAFTLTDYQALAEGAWAWRIGVDDVTNDSTESYTFSTAATFNVSAVGADILNVINFPNPFDGNTTIRYKLTRAAASVKIKIYNAAGRLVRALDGDTSGTSRSAEYNDVLWDGRNGVGDNVLNGVYPYEVVATFADGSVKRARGKAVKLR